MCVETHCVCVRVCVQKKMMGIMTHVIGCVRSKLSSKVGYFEFYGLDFMIDNDMKARTCLSSQNTSTSYTSHQPESRGFYVIFH